MAKLSEISNAPGQFIFNCPGCGLSHVVVTKDANPEQCYGTSRWDFNGDLVKPTVSPSLLVQWNEGDIRKVCHFFIREGTIQFLNDCTHDKAGITLELPEM